MGGLAGQECEPLPRVAEPFRVPAYQREYGTSTSNNSLLSGIVRPSPAFALALADREYRFRQIRAFPLQTANLSIPDPGVEGGYQSGVYGRRDPKANPTAELPNCRSQLNIPLMLFRVARLVVGPRFRCRLKRVSLLFWCIAVCTLRGAVDESGRLDRLVALARLWATVEYFHPSASVRQIGWDDAVVEAIPAVESTTTSQELAEVLSRLLARLNDPVTIVVEPQTLTSAAVGSGRTSARTTAQGILIITIVPPTNPPEIDKHIDALSAAKGLVVDLRAGGGL